MSLSDMGLAQVTDTHMLAVLAVSRRGPAGNMSLLCPLRDPQASVAQGVAQPWGAQRAQVILLEHLKDVGCLHTQHTTAIGCSWALGTFWAVSEGQGDEKEG